MTKYFLKNWQIFLIIFKYQLRTFLTVQTEINCSTLVFQFPKTKCNIFLWNFYIFLWNYKIFLKTLNIFLTIFKYQLRTLNISHCSDWSQLFHIETFIFILFCSNNSNTTKFDIFLCKLNYFFEIKNIFLCNFNYFFEIMNIFVYISLLN